MMQEGLQHKTAGPRAPIDPSTVKFEMWRNCTCFVCAASPSELDGASVSLASVQQTLVGNRGSLSGLFALLVPCLREGGAQAAAAAAVLARVPALAAPQLLAALAPTLVLWCRRTFYVPVHHGGAAPETRKLLVGGCSHAHPPVVSCAVVRHPVPRAQCLR